MAEWIWLNGETLPMEDARISVEDRGFQFADGVYEVIRLYDGQPSALPQHLARLQRSAAGIRLELPLSLGDLQAEISSYLAKISAGEGMIYLQLTRGASPRLHPFPHLLGKDVPATLLFYYRPLPTLKEPGGEPGAKIISLEDDRWQRCWIKTIALLPNVLAKSAAVEAGADEAVFIHEGVVTECSASNIFIVTHGTVQTHPIGKKVLPGVIRQLLIDCCAKTQTPLLERPFTLEEGRRADEVFITSTTREITPVASWDGKGLPGSEGGPVTLKLHRGLREVIAAELEAGVVVSA